MIWRIFFWKNIYFGRVVVWCGVNWKIIQMFRSIHSAKCPFFYSSMTVSSYHPGAKSVLRQGIESILSPKQQRRPLFLYKSFIYAVNFTPNNITQQKLFVQETHEIDSERLGPPQKPVQEASSCDAWEASTCRPPRSCWCPPPAVTKQCRGGGVNILELPTTHHASIFALGSLTQWRKSWCSCPVVMLTALCLLWSWGRGGKGNLILRRQMIKLKIG